MIIDIKQDIPKDDSRFWEIVATMVFDCPSATSETSKKKNAERKYYPVSARGSSFRERHIRGSLLTTLLIQIKKIVGTNQFINVGAEDNVSKIFAGINYEEKIVYKKHSNMSEVEAIYYYIRNAFAHGSFEVFNKENVRMYKLESRKKDNIKAQMLLKEETLLEFCNIAEFSKKQVENLQKKKQKR